MDTAFRPNSPCQPMECNISPIQEDSSKGSAIQGSVWTEVDDGPVLEVLSGSSLCNCQIWLCRAT